MNKSKKVIISLAVASLSLGSLIYAEPMLASTNPVPEKAAQIKQTPRKIGKNEQTGGLVQTLLPRALPLNQLQSTNTGSSLGSSGSTDNLPQTQSSASTPIVGAGSLPTLWDPLNPNSGNYGQTTPVLDQGIQNICWSFTGSDTISKSALTQLGVNQPLSPVYYDYLSAVNAFSGINNPTGIILPVSSTSFAPRQLSTDGNTLDYVPTMSVQGYDPVSSADFPQPLPATTAIDTPTSQAAFNQLPKSNLHVSDSYKITGFAPNNLPSTPSIMNRVNQIKQMVYQYGAVQFGLEADVSLYAPYYNATNNASYVPYSAAQAGSNLVYSYSGQLYLNQDHELQIVGYDDSYSRTHFSQNPGMDGAFVVKNTWGTSWGAKGYLYVSYADVYVAGSEIYADEVSATKAGEKTYSATNVSPEASTWYYPLSNSNGSIVNTIFSNTFTSQNLSGGQVEQLNSISAYIDQAGTTVQVLYKMGAANSGAYTNLGSYTFTDAGYQTILLSQIIDLPNNSSYTVAIKIMSLPAGCTTLNVPIQVHSNGSTGVYPILTTGNSWMNYGNKWINLSSNEGENLYLGANTGVVAATKTPVYRLYNPRNLEHLYTSSANEVNTLVNIGWGEYEGVSYYAPLSGGIPIYRLYNPQIKMHLYTSDANEKNVLSTRGWSFEGIVFYGATSTTGNIPVYRLYNSQIKQHLFTTDNNEKNVLQTRGWKYEGISWYGMN